MSIESFRRAMLEMIELSKEKAALDEKRRQLSEQTRLNGIKVFVAKKGDSDNSWTICSSKEEAESLSSQVEEMVMVLGTDSISVIKQSIIVNPCLEGH